MSSANDHIDIETYILADDAVGREFADLLVRRRAEHVAVNLIYDVLASRGTSNVFFECLRVDCQATQRSTPPTELFRASRALPYWR